MTPYLQVKNWEELQHYKKRNPPWIKLYRRLMTDGDFHRLSELHQWQLVRIWLVSAEEHPGGWVPNDEKWLRRMIGTLKPIPTREFIEGGWLIPRNQAEYDLERASSDASTVASTEVEIDPLCWPPEVQRFIKNPSFLPSPPTDGTDGRNINLEQILKDAS